MRDLQIEPKWLGSLFGIIAFVVSSLVFLFYNNDFLESVIKIIVTSICFYILGTTVAIIFNYIANTNSQNST